MLAHRSLQTADHYLQGRRVAVVVTQCPECLIRFESCKNNLFYRKQSTSGSRTQPIYGQSLVDTGSNWLK